ncbi:MAG: adenosylmethionine decarboxylase [Fimbriimonadaceae bacterium]|nr:adenosylmethionine decarboxylase [Fimbriimonadaceae bacterium]
MSILIILSSLLAFSALAVEPKRSFWDALKGLVSRLARPWLAAPTVTTEEGWTFVRCDNVRAFREWLSEDESGFPPSDGEEPSLGSHLLIELYGCEPRLLEQESSVGEAMREAAVKSEATVVATSFHEFQPYGVSGAVIIQESHYTIHTWPEHGYAAVDLFYCGGTVRVHRAVEVLQERFQPVRVKFLVVRRGLQSEVHR